MTLVTKQKSFDGEMRLTNKATLGTYNTEYKSCFLFFFCSLVLPVSSQGKIHFMGREKTNPLLLMSRSLEEEDMFSILSLSSSSQQKKAMYSVTRSCRGLRPG